VQPFAKANKLFSYFNLNSDALWRETYLSHQGYLNLAREVSPYAKVDHFHVKAVFHDVMHTVYLGFGRDLGACSIHMLHEHGKLPPAETLDVSLRLLWLQFRDRHKDLNLQKPKGSFTPTGLMFGAQDYPELSTRFKAVTVKHLLQFLCDLCQEVNAPELLTACLWSLCECFSFWNASGVILADEVAQQCFELGMSCLRSYFALAQQSQVRGKLWFKIRPKHHYWLHLLEFQLETKLNPVWVCSAFDDESFMGKTKNVGKMTRGFSNLSNSAIKRYILHMQLRWKQVT